MRHIAMTRRSLFGLLAAVAVAGPTGVAVAVQPTVTVHRDPNCGCCTGWVRHLREADFDVRVEETSDLEAIRKRLRVPTELTACHTGEIAGYAVEGHVPAAAIRRLLLDRPNARGIAVPGMPVGSPGMEGGNPQPYTVILFGPEGQHPFMRFAGKQAIS